MSDDWVDVPSLAPPPKADDGWADVPAPGAAPEAGPSPPISGPDGWSSASHDFVNSTPTGGIMKAFGQGFREASGPEPLGLSMESKKWLSKIGIFAPSGQSKFENPFQAFNEGVIVPAAAALDGAIRTFSGTYRGLQSAGVEAGLDRDIVSIPDAFMGSPGALGEIRMRSGLSKDALVGNPDAAPSVAATAMQSGFDAYHGSPHSFDAFSTSRIGTGEGAQAYGHGLYFAESQGVARSYRDALGGDGATIDGKKYNPYNPLHAAAAQLEESGSREAAIKDMGAVARADTDPDQFTSRVLAILKSDRELPKIENTEGHLYQVRINADQDRMLDWDKPLSEQPSILSALQDVTPKPGWLARQIEGLKVIRHDMATNPESTGATAYGALERLLGKDRASEALHDAGVPGIKYLDQGSRTAGDGTRNFVVFNENDIQITHKNGEPIPTPQDHIAQAQDLGVIGPDRPAITDGPPKDVAEKVISRNADQASEKVTQDVPGEQDAWQQRFDGFVGKLEAPDDVKQLIRDAAKENGDFLPAREGDIPLSHVEAISEAAGVDPASVDARGLGRTLKNDNEVRTAMRLMMQVTDDVKTAAREVKADGSPESLIKLQESIMRRDMAVEQVVGLRAEWGRTGNVFQEFLRDVKDQEGLNNFLKDKGRNPTDLREIADAIDTLDRGSAAKVLNDMRGKQMSPFYYTWVNGLISGILTHTKYVAANALYGVTEYGVTTPIAALIGEAKKLTGLGSDVDRVFHGEALAHTYGMLAAVPTSIIASARSIRAGVRAPLESEIALRQAAIARGERVPASLERAVNPAMMGERPIPGVWGRIVGAPGDVAGAIHTFFKILGERAGIEAEAYRAASKEGLSPTDDAFWQRRAQHAANPTEEMRQRAVEGAYKGTFMQELGPRGKAFQKITKELPGAKWIFPFTHIPVNLLKATYEHTPAALLDSEMRADITGKNGGIRQDKAIARMVVGSSIMGWFVNAQMTGQATGDYPRDPKERDAWKLAGKQPNSILIGDHWVSYARFGPAGDLAALGANIGTVIHHLKSEDDDAMTKATYHAAEAAGKLLIDEAGFQSLANIFEAYHDPDKRGAQFVASQAASLIPFSSLLGQTASGGIPFTGGFLGDPNMRQAKTFIDGLKYRIPALRESLLPKRDWSGQPIPNPQYGNILRQTQVNADPVDMEMAALGMHPAPPQDRIKGVKLPAKLYDTYQATAGPYTRTALSNMVNQDGWHDLPISVRQEVFKNTIHATREGAAAAMQMRYPQLIQQGVADRIAKINGQKPGKLVDAAP